MTAAEPWLLLALITLGLIDLAAIITGWLADRHITHTVRHRKE